MKLRLHEDSEIDFTNNPFVKYVSKKNNIPINLVNAMRKKELESAMIGKIIVTEEELNKRLKGCVYVKEDGVWNLYTGKKFIHWRNKMRGINNEKLVGDVAFPGVARGRVVIHQSWTDVIEVQEGDVLVTGMTNPRLIPLLKNVAAIVTDEGGITCHAAIISRELKKPCIVGTKNATTVLTDGDLVEVDAYKGVVHIIEKHKK
jgi:phosphoenolpyruvate synthase/pyruvate phosphate dikinase